MSSTSLAAVTVTALGLTAVQYGMPNLNFSRENLPSQLEL